MANEGAKPKIKLSEIRAKYPMYGDMSDEQLLGGLRKKFYADIPMAQFANAIDFDTSGSPTEGMSGADKFLAGAGKAFVDVGRGVGQMVGLVDRADVEESRKRDAPLMATGAGIAGNVTGNLAAMAPAIFIPGAATVPGAAAIGAASGFMQPSTSTLETLANTGLGGGLGGGAVVAGNALGAAYQGAKAIAAPLSHSGREGIAARTLQRFAADPARAAREINTAPRNLVPGSYPTAAELTSDGGIAQLQRSVRNMDPQQNAAFTARDQAQSSARAKVLQDIAGDEGKREFFDAARTTNANELYKKAFAEAIDPDTLAPATLRSIDTLMTRPSMQRALAEGRELAAESGITINQAGKGNVEALHYAKLALDDQIAATGANAIGPTRKRALMATRDKLLDVMDEMSPAYGEARRQYAADSVPINRMDIGNRLYETLKPATTDFGGITRENTAAYTKAVRAGDATAAKATGFKGSKLADILTADELQAVNNVAKDLARKANSNELGRAVGSNTAQNLISQNVLEQMAGPLGLQPGVISSLLEATVGRAGGALGKLSEPKIQQMLGQAMLDPDYAAMLLQRAMTPTTTQRLAARVAPNLGPVGAATAASINANQGPAQ